MAYVDYSSHWVLDQFLTYLESNQLGANDKHIVDSFSVEHNWNSSTADGTHKTNSINGSAINTTPASTGSQAVAGSATWTPTVGVYQMVNGQAVGANGLILQIYVSAGWRGSYVLDYLAYLLVSGIMFFDGSNMRLQNTNNTDSYTVWYQKF